MRVIIAGGRDFNDRDFLFKHCFEFLKQFDFNNINIISGGQVTIDQITGEKYGADYLGEIFAEAYEFKVTRFNADWGKYKKAAGPIRNKQMADYADALIAFWDGKSKGTKNMIDLAKNNGLKIRIINY